jgi:hypothetical protein
MKKLLLLTTALLISLASMAYDVEIDGIYYYLYNNDKTAEVANGTDKYSGEVVIPSSITQGSIEYEVTSIGNYAFNQCTELTSVVIPETVKYIGPRSLEGYSGVYVSDDNPYFEEKDGIVYTVEGNTNSGPYVIANGGQVRQKSYFVSNPAIAGYGLPAYETEETKTTVSYPCWVKSGNDYYYRVSEGVNAHGWKNIRSADGHTYRFYFDDKGKMLTGWQQIGDAWYYFHDTPGSGREGAMYVSDQDGKQHIATFD